MVESFFSHLLTKHAYPYEENALYINKTRIVGIRLLQKPYTGTCDLCKISFRNDKTFKRIVWALLLPSRHNKKCCNPCGVNILRNLAMTVLPQTKPKSNPFEDRDS
ncbi:hypothetical protein MUP79_02650 [Candidatus Bathyarchaeota archaeon]|nr:hypothetical protein [Candidatus Bathyarchaeota archaeon]